MVVNLLIKTQNFSVENGKMIEGVIDLSTIKIKKLEIKPDENGEFDFILPIDYLAKLHTTGEIHSSLILRLVRSGVV